MTGSLPVPALDLDADVLVLGGGPAGTWAAGGNTVWYVPPGPARETPAQLNQCVAPAPLHRQPVGGPDVRQLGAHRRYRVQARKVVTRRAVSVGRSRMNR
jgi:hypothetical protein